MIDSNADRIWILGMGRERLRLSSQWKNQRHKPQQDDMAFHEIVAPLFVALPGDGGGYTIRTRVRCEKGK